MENTQNTGKVDFDKPEQDNSRSTQQENLMNKNLRRVLVGVSVLVALVVGMVVGGVNHLFTDEPKKPVESFEDGQIIDDAQVNEKLHLKEGQSVYVSADSLVTMEDSTTYLRSGMTVEWGDTKENGDFDIWTSVKNKHVFSHKPEWKHSVKLTWVTPPPEAIGAPCGWFVLDVPKGVFPEVAQYDDDYLKGEKDFMEVTLPSINDGWVS